MSGARAPGLSLGGLALLLVGLLAQNFGGVLLEFAGLGLLLWLCYVLAGPLAQPRVCYRVRYHYPSAAPGQNVARVGALLRVLARRGGRVELYWRRVDGDLELYIAVSATVEAAFRGMLPELWPGAVVERVRELPEPPRAAACLYRVQGGGAGAQFDFAALFNDLEQAPPALWTHLTAAGWVLLAGAAVSAHPLAGLRLRAVPCSARVGAIARLAWLYPFVTAWPVPATARGAKSTSGSPLAVRWPRTDLVPSLDAEIALMLPPPLDYQPPARLWQLGRAATGAMPIGLDMARAGQWGHVLVIGGTGGDRQGTTLRLLAQAGAAGWGLLALDHSGRLGKQLYELAPAEVRRHSAQIDLHARRGTVRPGLLDVAPPSADPAGQAQALLLALETRLPAYLRFLGQLGLHAATLGPAREIAPADVTVQLLAHYRARLSGAPAHALPEVPVLYATWSSASGFNERLHSETAAWRRPDEALRAALVAAGTPGAECARRAAQLLDGAAANLGALDPADLQLYSGSLRARLAPAATSPLLRAAWGELTPANMLLDGPDMALLLGNLSYGDSSERGAARMYGLYLLALLEGFSLERELLGHVDRPLVIAWEELAPAWSALKPADITRLAANLRAGAMNLIVLDEGWNGLDDAQAAALRAALDNWVVGALPAAAAARIGAELQTLGAPGGFSCSALPTGHALVRCQGDTADMLCTVITAAREGNAAATGAHPRRGTRDGETNAGLARATTAGSGIPLAAGAGAQEGE